MAPQQVVPAVEEALVEAEAAQAVLAAPLEPGKMPTWEDSIEALDTLSERLRRVTTPIHHLLAVSESPELREAWNAVLPRVTAFWSRLYLDQGIWSRIQAFAESPAARTLNSLQRRHLDRTLRDFKRAGASLAPVERERLEAIEVALSELEQTFSEHVLDATASWSLHIDDETELDGIPEDALERFAAKAQQDGKAGGWTLTLDAPAVQAVLKHARSRSLRETVHQAYLVRGTEAPWDNRPLIPQILKLRQEKARLLGYPDYPDFRLEPQMAATGEKARAFVSDLVGRTRPFWLRDLEALAEEARTWGIETLRPWDVSWLAENLRKRRYDLDEEALRPYFPLERVLQGMFALAQRLFGLTITEEPTSQVWHPDVRYFRMADADGTHLASFYVDFFPRPEKRQGAWMADFIYGDPDRGHPHLGQMACNFPPPSQGKPSLLPHREVETLFHEFGHLLHHCTSRVPIEGRGGINVAWDWVELPSQLMENWTWEEEALALISGHWETGDPLPRPLLERMLEARRFMGGWSQMRQLSFGTMDLALHTTYDADRDGDAVAWASAQLLPLSPDETFAAAHPLPSFLHLFSGGYAASYYSYLWSEVLEADLFRRFKEEGIFSPALGRAYLDTILSQGDVEDPDVLFRRFMGRDPDPEALLERNLGAA
jgi:oligopeptidase A